MLFKTVTGVPFCKLSHLSITMYLRDNRSKFDNGNALIATDYRALVGKIRRGAQTTVKQDKAGLRIKLEPSQYSGCRQPDRRNNSALVD